MKNIFKTKITKTDTLGRKALEFIAFLVLYSLFFSVMELLWNKFIAGNGFTFDPGQIPWILVSGTIIWTVFLIFDIRRDRKDNSDKEE